MIGKFSYDYMGSAQNGFEERIKKHLDYLLKLEIAKNIKDIPIFYFETSSCKCMYHLFRVENEEILRLGNLFKNYEMGEDLK